MYQPYPLAESNAEAGPSQPRPSPPHIQPKPKKRRRLQFTSDLRAKNSTIQRYNPDGTETVEYLHAQSTARLKRKWENIFERFKDAHLQEQDEIYLGNRANGEPIVVVKDRGSLRGLRQNMTFGVFIKDEELQGWRDRPEAREMEEKDKEEEDEDFDPSPDPLQAQRRRQFLARVSSSESPDEEEEEDPAANDPDLREFLQAEARRKAMLGSQGEEEGQDDEDEVIDFGDPTWANSDAYDYEAPPSLSKSRAKVHRITAASPQVTSIRPPTQPDLIASSSEDESEPDIVTIHSDSDDELIDTIRAKRQNVEELLQCTTAFETLPYNDIFGLADLLKISDGSSRLYVDLRSDDDDEDEVEDEVEVVEMLLDDAPKEGDDAVEVQVDKDKKQMTEASSPYASSMVGNPASSQPSDGTPSQGSMLPPSSSASTNVTAHLASPTVERLARVKTVEPERTPVRASTMLSSAKTSYPDVVIVTSSPVEAEFPRITTPTAPAHRSSTPISLSSPHTVPQHISTTPAQPPSAPRITTPDRSSSHHQQHLSSRTKSQLSTEPKPCTPTSSSFLTSNSPVLSSSSSSSRKRAHKKTKRRSRAHLFATSSDDEDQVGEIRPECGGPGKCTKTFCLFCVSLS
ncbi:uncharacterized protein UTRI_05247 [Ustilago trichophora]|uniref:Uncharacterized protein n=1 Tax=Ustilago trichophora TaxID=86804 RepID=A0A5C3EKM4_9BASI|nr:uncharacterized protein UTRI_05247 [Ustilago trichophora]